MEQGRTVLPNPRRPCGPVRGVGCGSADPAWRRRCYRAQPDREARRPGSPCAEYPVCAVWWLPDCECPEGGPWPEHNASRHVPVRFPTNRYPRAKSLWWNIVLSIATLAITRRPVKDKGALMQTLHLRFRDLRAIFLGRDSSRWPTPSMPRASTWKGAPPLPNLPSPTSAVGALPKTSRQRLDRNPTLGAGLPLALTFREPRVVGPDGADTRQARTSEAHWAASNGLSCSIRPQRCQRAPRYEARVEWKKTSDIAGVAPVRKPAHRRPLSSVGG